VKKTFIDAGSTISSCREERSNSIPAHPSGISIALPGSSELEVDQI